MNQDLARMILGNIGDGIISVNSSFTIVFANPVACSILGISYESIIGSDARKIRLATYDDACHKTPVDPLGLVLSTGECDNGLGPMSIESVVDRMVYVECTTTPIKNADGNVIGAVMVLRDVSEEMQLATLLKLANERYKVLFDNIRSSVAVYESADGDVFKIVDFNPAAEMLEGVKKKDIIHKSVVDIFPGVSAIGVLDALKRVWKTGDSERVPCAMYEDAVRKGWRDNYIYKLPTGEVVAVYDDVSDKKHVADKVSNAIAKLRDNETRFRGLFDNSPVGMIFSADSPNHQITNVNQAFCDLVGYAKEELIGKNIIDLTHKDDIAKTLQYINNVLEKIVTPRIVKRYVNKDGEIRWVSVFMSHIKHADGRIEHFSEVIDITKSVEAEKDAKKYFDLIDATGKMAKVGGWEFDIATGIQTWTDEVYRIHDVGKDFVPTVESGISFYAPSSKEAITRAVSETVNTGKPFDLELEFVTSKGVHKWVHSIGKLSPDGKRVFGTFQDITERRTAEMEKGFLAKVMSELNSFDSKNRNVIANIMGDIKQFAGFDAVAIRLPERMGSADDQIDYPFYFHDGFDQEFVASENSLVCRGNDGPILSKDGSVVLACMCGNVILGNTKNGKPYFTDNGTFWTNNLSQVISNADVHDLGNMPRSTCWRYGYESVAIIPFMSGDKLVGEMLLCSRRKGAIDKSMIGFLEEVGKAMGIAFARIQTRKSIDENRNALARANGILSVECDVAISMASGDERGLEAVLRKAGKKLRVRWLCVVVVGEGGAMGKWTDEGGSSVNSIDDVAKFDDKDVVDIRKWITDKESYVGDMEGLPPCLARISKPVGGHWIAIPVLGNGKQNLSGVLMASAKNGRKWSKDEHEAMVGLATLLCILAKDEKNRNELSRRIEQTISEMSEIIGIPKENSGGEHA